MHRTRAISVGLAVLLAGCSTGGGTSTPAQPTADAVPTTVGSPATATSRPTTRPLPTAGPRHLPGCLNPNCVPGRLDRPGPLPAGPYTTRNFLASQLGVIVPNGWESPEDSSGEFKLQPIGHDSTSLDFWIDIFPIVDGPLPVERVKGYDGTAKALLDWVVRNPNVRVTLREPAMLGRLQAEVMEIERSPKAVNVDPECPTQDCVGLFGNDWWEDTYSQGEDFRLRLFAADATWGGEDHGVYAMLTTWNATDLEAFFAVGNEVVRTAVIPPDVQQ